MWCMRADFKVGIHVNFNWAVPDIYSRYVYENNNDIVNFFIIIYIAHLRKRLYMVMTSSSDVRALFTREPF